jgi:membrane protease YdiL (CAAX protease family)
MENNLLGRRQLVTLAILVEGGLAVLALLAGWCFDVPFWERISWNGAAICRGVLVSVPMLLLFLGCLSRPVGPLRSLKRFADEVIRPLFEPCTLLELAIISLLAGVGEEALFRGVVQHILCDLMGPWGGIILTAALFGAAHPISVSYFLLATLMGVYLGWVCVFFDNLLTVIVAHALYDFVALVVLCRRRSGSV